MLLLASELHVHTINTMEKPLFASENPKEALSKAIKTKLEESLSKVTLLCPKMIEK